MPESPSYQKLAHCILPGFRNFWNKNTMFGKQFNLAYNGDSVRALDTASVACYDKHHHAHGEAVGVYGPTGT